MSDADKKWWGYRSGKRKRVIELSIDHNRSRWEAMPRTTHVKSFAVDIDYRSPFQVGPPRAPRIRVEAGRAIGGLSHHRPLKAPKNNFTKACCTCHNPKHFIGGSGRRAARFGYGAREGGSSLSAQHDSLPSCPSCLFRILCDGRLQLYAQRTGAVKG